MRASILPEYAAVAFTALAHPDELAESELADARRVAEEASRHFIAPGTKTAPEDQIALNAGFSRVPGLEVPKLTLGTRGRHDLAERARRLLPNEFAPDKPVTRPPDNGTIIREPTEAENLQGTVSRDGSVKRPVAAQVSVYRRLAHARRGSTRNGQHSMGVPRRRCPDLCRRRVSRRTGQG